MFSNAFSSPDTSEFFDVQFCSSDRIVIIRNHELSQKLNLDLLRNLYFSTNVNLNLALPLPLALPLILKST